MRSSVAADSGVDPTQNSFLTTRTASRVDAFAASPAFRVQVALLMAAVSLVGAFVSYTAAERSSDASHLASLASQQHSEEQQVHLQIEAMVNQDERTLVRAEPEWKAYQSSMQEADAIRPSDPARAVQLDLAAQESFARYAQLYSFFRVGLPGQTTETLVFDPDFVRADLRVQDPTLFRASSKLTSEDAHTAAGIANATVATVILLVGALLLLTVGHVTGGRRGVAFAAAGAALALGGTIWFAVLNIGPAQFLFGAAAAVTLVLIIVRLPRFQSAFAGPERHSSLVSTLAAAARPDSLANAPVEGPSAPSFERHIAVAIAVATLVGAGVGYLQAQTSRISEEEGWRAQNSGIEAIGALRSSDEAFALDVDAYKEAMVLAADDWSTEQLAAYAAFSGDSAQAALLDAEAERREAAAQHQLDRSSLQSSLGTTGVIGRAELIPMYAETWRDAAKLVGLQDAANSASQTWGARGGVYLSVLSWLAVAVYLLGLSVTFRAPIARRVLTTVGLILVVVAVGIALRTVAQPSPPPEDVVDEAAVAYAAGFVHALSGEPEAAVTEYSRAVELRPDFGIASRDLAQAIMATGSAPGNVFRANFTTEAVEQAIGALEAARENRADTAGVMLNLGAMLFHRAIQSESQADMERSLEATAEGLLLGDAFDKTYGEHNYAELIGLMNYGLALAGTGRLEEASEKYRELAGLIFELPPSRRPLLVGSALMPLDLLLSAPQPPTEDEVTALKELVVSTAYGVDGSSDPVVTEATVDLLPASVVWHATIPGFDDASDSLVVQWYRRDPELESWTAEARLSGALSFGYINEAGQFGRDPTADSFWGSTNGMLTNEPRACVQTGKYRVEFYVNGHLQGVTASGDRASEDAPQIAPDIGLMMCRPEGWERTGAAGWSTGVGSPDGSQGVVALRLFQPRNGTPAENDRIAMERALRLSAVVGLPEGIEATVQAEVPGATVIGFGPSWQLHAYPEGTAKIAAVPASDGSEIVVCVYGPDEWVSSEEAGEIVTSVILAGAPRYAYPG